MTDTLDALVERLRDQAADRNKTYRLRHAEAMREKAAQWRAANKHKRHAHMAVQYAVRCGTLIPNPVCEDCKAAPSQVSHHEDYSKLLDVVWLCKPCHSKRHGRIIRNTPPINGASVGTHKLTEDEVLHIRALRRGVWSNREIGRQYGVSESNIRQILARQTWKHL